MRKWRLRDSLFHLWEVTGQDVNSRLSGHLLSNAPLKVSATLSVCRVYQEHGLPQDTETFPGVGTKAAVSPVVIG